MNKVLLIIQREYMSRVKKKSFIVMTLLTPLLIAGFYGMMFYFTYRGMEGSQNKIAVISENKSLTEKLPAKKNRTYVYVNQPLKEMKASLGKSGYDYILYLPDFKLDHPQGIQILGTKQAGLTLGSSISNDIEELISMQKLKSSGISQNDLDKLKTEVDIDTKKINEAGLEEDSSAGASTIVAYIAGVFMFMFIMLYGVQVMRGV
ncbi:ABC transporter permease, partial [Pedobacter sp.]|uniref:ABC transporter permease n=1 Tax=Pedobacter sp. TaxID=1411316 RepID=UPI003D7F47E4